MSGDFDILIVAQAGRIAFEAALFAASLRARAPGFAGRLYVAEPQPGPLWPDDPRMSDDLRDLFRRLDATPLPFASRHFGAAYPHGNKVEAMAALPDDRPCLFCDSDTLVLHELAGTDPGPIPTASMRRENTWPVDQPYGPEPEEIWRTLYDRFDLDFDASLDPQAKSTDWRRFLYFNAGLVFAPRARAFAADWLRLMTAIRNDPPPCQPLDPWLDQVALPLAVTAHGGGRPGPGFLALDGPLLRHYRKMPLFFATAEDEALAIARDVAAPNWLKKVLKPHEPFRRFLYQGAGDRARALFDRDALPGAEKDIRHRLRKNGLWIV